METSKYFKKAIYLDQSPAAADYFEECTASLFVVDSSHSWVDVFADHMSSRKENEVRTNSDNLVSPDIMHNNLEMDSERLQMAANDGKHNDHNNCAIEPGLDLHRVSHKEDLQRFVKARLRAVHFKCTGADFSKATERQSRIL